MKFFLDNTFSPREARGLSALFDEHSFLHLRERWPEDAHDQAWMSELTREGGWCVITHDMALSREHRYLVEAHRRSTNVLVFLTRPWSTMRLPDRFALFVKRFERLSAEVGRSRHGTVLRLTPRGAIVRL